MKEKRKEKKKILRVSSLTTQQLAPAWIERIINRTERYPTALKRVKKKEISLDRI